MASAVANPLLRPGNRFKIPVCLSQPPLGISSANNKIAKEAQFQQKLRFNWLNEDMVADGDPGTCTWLEYSEEWKRWQQQKKEPLWILGDAGMGKTVLAKFVLQRAREGRYDENDGAPKHVIGYFFDGRDPMRMDFNGLLRALLYHLLLQDGELFRHVRGKDIFSSPPDSVSLTTSSLIESLFAIFEDPLLDKTMLVVDAVDECRVSCWPEIFDLLIKAQTSPNIQLIITARDSTELRKMFGISFSINLNSNSDKPTSSVQLYIKKEVQRVLGGQTLANNFSNNFVHDFESLLLERSSASFLWVRLAIRYVERQRTTFLSRRAMESLPSISGISSLFLKYIRTEFLFEKIPLLSVYIVMEAKAPLSLSALSFLSAATLGEQSSLPASGDSKLSTILESTIRGFEDEIKNVPFLQIREGTVSLMHSALSGILKTEHILEELVEFFLKRNTQQANESGLVAMIGNSARSGLHPLLRNIHYMIAELCLSYLLASLREDNSDPLNFLSYAVLYWFEHIRSAGMYATDPDRTTDSGYSDGSDDSPPQRLLNLVRQFLSSETVCDEGPTKPRGAKCTVFAKWIRQYEKYDETHSKRILPGEDLSKNVVAFTFAAFDLYWVLGQDIEYGGREALVIEHAQHTPLHFIVANDSFRSLEWLQKRWFPDHSSSEELQRLALADSSRQKSCPVVMAVELGNKEMVNLFIGLMRRAPVEARRFLGIQHSVAAKNGHKEIFLILYKEDLTDLLSDAEQKGVMESAAALDCVEVVNDIRTKHPMDQMSLVLVLHSAIRAYAKNTIEALIELIDTKNISMPAAKGRTALHEAADVGNEHVVKLLLSRGAAANAIDTARQTPLHLGSKGGFFGVCNCLLEKGKGVRVNLVDADGCVAFHYAAKNGHDSVLRRLLKAGSNVFASNKNGQLPLHLACEAAKESTVKLLLDENARAGAQDRNGRTPLHYAAQSGTKRIVWLLVDSGATMCPDEDDILPIHLAAETSSDIMVKELLKLGADALAEDAFGKTAVHHCLESSKPSHAVFQALMETVPEITLFLPHNPSVQPWFEEFSSKIITLQPLNKRGTDDFLLDQKEMDDTSGQDSLDSVALGRDIEAIATSEGQKTLDDLD
jgi:ankyrin repeat protein